MGRLMELLRELKIDDNTLVIFTSDNGPHSEGGHQHEYFNANGPLRGYKRDLYEGGIRVPTIAWWPGNIARGSKSDEPLAFYDFLPTACELAGVEAPKNIDGISFLATLTGSSQHEHDYLFWKYQEKLAVRKGKWKGVIPGKGKPLELYDLSADIGETKNLAAEKKDLVQYLTQCIEEATASGPVK
ncbi:MAG: arylsulfatase A [Limisphaerales bacterium]